MAIKAIIFDLGGIIIDIHQDKVITAFGELFKLEKHHVIAFSESDAFKQNLFAYERGEIDFPTFHANINHTLERASEIDSFKRAWLEMIGIIPQERLQTLETLKKAGLELYLYSNTCPEHIERLKECYVNIEEYFDTVYYSFAIGHRKPEAGGFLHILDNHGLTPSETLFVDDMPENIAAAERLSIKGLHLPQNLGISLKHFEDQLQGQDHAKH